MPHPRPTPEEIPPVLDCLEGRISIADLQRQRNLRHHIYVVSYIVRVLKYAIVYKLISITINKPQ